MSRSNCRPLRRRRQNDENRASLNTTIDLTFEENLRSRGPPSLISSNGTNNTSRSTSRAWELIDLSAEPDVDVPETRNALGHEPSSTHGACESQVGKGNESDDDLPLPPKMPVFDKPKIQPTCPVCFTELMTAGTVMATKCGHVFCKNCIMNCVQLNSTCPLCRKKISNKQLLVIYLQGQ